MNLDFLKTGEREWLRKQGWVELVEDVCGEFGFRVVWLVQESWVNVWVWEIVAYEDKNLLVPLFEWFDEKGHQEFTTEIERAKEWCYLDGFIKWDGCSQFDMGQQHLCGLRGYKKHVELLRYLWRRSFELMNREPEDGLWEDKA